MLIMELTSFPVEMFRVIQSFLAMYDCSGARDDIGYRGLMNSCSAFIPIRFETAYQTCQHTWGNRVLSTVYLRTRDPSKQISLIICRSKNHREKEICDSKMLEPFLDFLLLGMSRLLIASLNIVLPSLNCFSNVCQLSFYYCPGLTSLTGLRGIRKLVLKFLIDLVDISQIRNMNQLKVVDMFMCPKVLDVSSLHGVETVSIALVGGLCHNLHSLGKHKSFTFHDCHFICNDVSFLSSCENVSMLCASFLCDLSILQSVTGRLDLRAYKRFPVPLLGFTHFKDEHLTLHYFTFADRELLHNCPKLKSLSLRGCRGIDFGETGNPYPSRAEGSANF
jgi:hypothetical protein